MAYGQKSKVCQGRDSGTGQQWKLELFGLNVQKAKQSQHE